MSNRQANFIKHLTDLINSNTTGTIEVQNGQEIYIKCKIPMDQKLQ